MATEVTSDQPTPAGPGEWVSPISSELITASTIRIASPTITKDGDIYYLEMRPMEGGRCVGSANGSFKAPAVSCHFWDAAKRLQCIAFGRSRARRYAIAWYPCNEMYVHAMELMYAY